MDAAQILGYFIEEAKEHLDTLEQSLATFDQTLTDGDLLQELFRAAHSIKGGAAMLDLEPVRYVAGQLEDSFSGSLVKPPSVSDDKTASCKLEDANIFFAAST